MRDDGCVSTDHPDRDVNAEDQPITEISKADEPETVQQMDSVQYIPQLQEVGQAVAKEVDLAHFAAFLPA